MTDSNIIEIHSLNEPGVEVFGTLTEAQLRNRLHFRQAMSRQPCSVSDDTSKEMRPISSRLTPKYLSIQVSVNYFHN